MPRFVFLRHEMPLGSDRPTHWDFMLEFDGRLRTWALESAPRVGTVVKAKALPDHRIEYLDYEGLISQNRGVVTRWETGQFELIEMREGFCEVLLRSTGMTARVVARETESIDEWEVSVFDHRNPSPLSPDA